MADENEDAPTTPAWKPQPVSSGAPEKTSDAKWDDNNILIDPDLLEENLIQSEIILGKRDLDGKPIS